MTTKTPKPQNVVLSTMTVGQHFATCGVLRTRSGRTVAVCDIDRPYGFAAAALSDAETLAKKLGHTIVDA